ncbi:MAG: HD domain-containing protein [Humidesulfovibrio sp.]|nr:HD domain-containing protein [Humidesulfovibrio sp.]
MSPLWPSLPQPPVVGAERGQTWRIPSEARCVALWDRFDMPEHIRAHSRKVAQVACQVAEAGLKMGLPVCVDTVRASALLHDLAKIYCIRHGGNHSQLGGAWAMALTGNPLLAQGVIHHVYWPFEVDLRRFFTPLTVLYGDKRVAHDQIVPIEQRFGDLVERYGKTPEIRERIHSTNRQAKDIEDAFGRLLEKDLNAHDFNRGRLVD